jgi:UDP-GlcNAc:undecaprenyl-phosphate GlcNAc-1-phosphate transferase
MPFYSAHLMSAFLLAIVCIVSLEKIAGPMGLVDRPSGRKAHVGQVPVVGGLAIFLGILFAILSLGGAALERWDLIAGLFVLVVTGVFDDRFDLHPLRKMAAQVFAAGMLILPHDLTLELGALTIAPSAALSPLALPVTIVFVVGVINAFNMIDGLDGLAGGIAASAFAWLALVAAMAGRDGDLAVLLIFLSATLGFLIFNMRHPWCRKARVFMGDSGSMMLGAAIAYFILAESGSRTAPYAAHWPALLWLVALPCIDTGSLIVRRLRAGRNPMGADRWHLHHLLLDSGLSVSATTGWMVAISAVMGGIGVAGLLLGVPDVIMIAGLILPLVAHTAFVLRTTRRQRGLTGFSNRAAVSSTMPASLPVSGSATAATTEPL